QERKHQAARSQHSLLRAPFLTGIITEIGSQRRIAAAQTAGLVYARQLLMEDPMACTLQEFCSDTRRHLKSEPLPAALEKVAHQLARPFGQSGLCGGDLPR